MTGHPYWATLAVAFVLWLVLVWAALAATAEPSDSVSLWVIVKLATPMAILTVLASHVGRMLAGLP